MTDWFKRITSFISFQREDITRSFEPIEEKNILYHPTDSLVLGAYQEKKDPTFSYSQKREHAPHTLRAICRENKPHVQPPSHFMKDDKNTMSSDMNTPEISDSDDNIKALKRLRELPRGTHVDSRVAAIKELLGEVELFKSLKALRWPKGVICPRCHSSNIVRREAPSKAVDQRHYYVCLNCKGEGGLSGFDDLTGLPIDSLGGLRQSILVWYLIGFCSISQIAKLLGLSLETVARLAQEGCELAETPASDKLQARRVALEAEKKEKKAAREAAGIKDTELDTTRSASKSPLKPNPKTKF